ncbi:MAG: hypothetical protein LBS31_06750 [Candidatus Adiutrix sp.]|jgi:hypothetical protein|nr:hypothetical protein [Candidatus Adiutrix sp.]
MSSHIDSDKPAARVAVKVPHPDSLVEVRVSPPENNFEVKVSSGGEVIEVRIQPGASLIEVRISPPRPWAADEEDPPRPWATDEEDPPRPWAADEEEREGQGPFITVPVADVPLAADVPPAADVPLAAAYELSDEVQRILAADDDDDDDDDDIEAGLLEDGEVYLEEAGAVAPAVAPAAAPAAQPAVEPEVTAEAEADEPGATEAGFEAGLEDDDEAIEAYLREAGAVAPAAQPAAQPAAEPDELGETKTGETKKPEAAGLPREPVPADDQSADFFEGLDELTRDIDIDGPAAETAERFPGVGIEDTAAGAAWPDLEDAAAGAAGVFEETGGEALSEVTSVNVEEELEADGDFPPPAGNPVSGDDPIGAAARAALARLSAAVSDEKAYYKDHPPLPRPPAPDVTNIIPADSLVAQQARAEVSERAVERLRQGGETGGGADEAKAEARAAARARPPEEPPAEVKPTGGIAVNPEKRPRMTRLPLLRPPSFMGREAVTAVLVEILPDEQTTHQPADLTSGPMSEDELMDLSSIDKPEDEPLDIDHIDVANIDIDLEKSAASEVVFKARPLLKANSGNTILPPKK